MHTRRHLLTIGATLALALCSASLPAVADELTPSARKLAAFYDRLDVEDRWIAGQHVDWQTGEPDGVAETVPGRHTHCSAFVAAVAERLGIYILRPPKHGQVLLANAQSEWLPAAGQGQGWHPLDGPFAAQKAANWGLFVVASYHNRNDDRPGHIAIVRPSRKPAEAVAEEGPDVIQAGTRNSTLVSLRHGFEGHPHAWDDNEVAYFAHVVARVP